MTLLIFFHLENLLSLEEDNGEDEKDDAGEVMGFYFGWEPWIDSKKKKVLK